MCNGVARAVYSYGMRSYDRTIEEPLCETCVSLLRELNAVTDLEPVEA